MHIRLTSEYRRRFATALLSIILSGFIVAPAFASGGGAGGGSAGGGAGNSGRVLVQSEFERGKRVFRRKLYCLTCPLGTMVLTRESADEVLAELGRKGEYGKILSYRERRSVKQYLESRFRL